MASAGSPDVAAILAAEDRRARAIIERDVATLEATFDDEFRFTHSNGLQDSKASYLAAIKSGTFEYRAIVRVEERVTVWDDTAVINGRFELDVVVTGQLKHISSLFLGVWRRKGGQWRIVAMQSTAAPARA